MSVTLIKKIQKKSISWLTDAFVFPQSIDFTLQSQYSKFYLLV